MSLDMMPSTWLSVTIGEICSKVTDGSHNPPKPSDSGLPMLSAKNIRAGKIDFSSGYRLITPEAFELEDKRTQICTNDLLLTIVGTLGRTALIPKSAPKFALQRSVAVLAAPSLIHQYFHFSIDDPAFQKQIFVNAKGTAQKGIYLKNLRALKIKLPPLAEQKQIAAKLDELLAQVETLKTRLDAIPAILKCFRQSVLAAAVSGRLTEEWRNQNDTMSSISLEDLKSAWLSVYEDAGKRFKQLEVEPLGSNLSILPAKWKWTRIGSVFDVHVGATPSRKEPRYWGGDVNWVSSSEVAFCRIKATKETITDEGLSNASTTVHPPGTVMLAMIGQGKTRGQPAILDVYACHNQNTAALRVLDEFCVPEYLYYFLTERYEETRRVGAGNNQQAMNKKVVQSLPFPLPPIEEQTEIVRRTEQLFTFADQIEQRLKDAQSRVNHLTQSILAKAFRGELTAGWREQNPDLISGENSAEALLERIKSEREKQTPIKRRRKTKS